MIVVTYDVDMTEKSGAKRLRKVAKVCENFGIRVQNSVFELLVDNGQYIKIKSELMKIIDLEKDSVRFYRLGKSWQTKIETIGIADQIKQDDTLIL